MRRTLLPEPAGWAITKLPRSWVTAANPLFPSCSHDEHAGGDSGGGSGGAERQHDPVRNRAIADPLIERVAGGVVQVGEEHDLAGPGVPRGPADLRRDRARVAPPA